MQIRLYRLFFGLIITIMFLTGCAAMDPFKSSGNGESGMRIVESGIGRFGCYASYKEKLGFVTKNMGFIKYDLSYFSPEDKSLCYWYRPNKPAPFGGTFTGVRVTLPDGTVLINDQMGAIGTYTFQGKPIFNVENIRLHNALKRKKIKPSQYGKCKVELYSQSKKLLDTKYFYLDTQEKILEMAKNNNESPDVIDLLEDNINRKGKTFYVLEKNGKFRFIYKGLTQDMVRAKVGEPWKIKDLGNGKVAWKYALSTTPYSVWVEANAIEGNNIAKILDKGNEWPIGHTFVLVFKDGVLVKIQ